MAILTIGLSCYDQFFFVNQFPKENTKEFATDLIESGGGPCGNASYLLGKWLEPNFHITSLKNDIYGQHICKELTSVGVRMDYALIDEKQITPLSSIIINEASRTIITHKRQQFKVLNEEQIKKIDIFIEKLNSTKQTHIVLIDGHEYELSEYILPKIKNKLVVMDAGNMRESNMKLAKYTHYLIASENFAKALIKKEELLEEDFSTVLAVIAKISNKNNTPIVTLGDRGCIYLQNNKVKRINAYHCLPIDTTGAGDIFHGVFVYGLAYQWELTRILKMASLTAAMSIEKKGVREAIPSFTNVEFNFINHVYQEKEV